MSETAPVTIDLQANGIADVLKSIEGVEARLLRFERTLTENGLKEGRTRVANTSRALSDTLKETEKMAREAVKADRDRTKAAEKEARERAKIEERAAKEAEKSATAAAKSAEKAAREETRVLERENAQRIRAAERTRAAQMRELYAYAREVERQERKATATVEREAKLREKIAHDEFQKRKQFAETISGRAVASAGNVIGTAGRIAGAAVTLGGAVSLYGAAQRGLEAERHAIMVSNSGYDQNSDRAENRRRRDPAEILRRVTSLEAETGIDKLELLKGLQTFTARSGDLSGGLAGMKSLAVMAKASGSDFGELATTAGVLKNQNPNLSAERLNQMILSVVGQGKRGAVELPELAKVGGRIASTSSYFAGDQATNQTRMLGLAQLSMIAGASAEDAATGVVRFGADLMKHRKHVEGILGAKSGVFNKQGEISDPAAVLQKLFVATGGDMGQLGHVFKDESSKIPRALRSTYKDAYDAAQGSEAEKRAAGGRAVADRVRYFTDATYSEKDMRGDFAAVMSGRAQKFEDAVRRLQEAIETQAAPYIERFASKLPEFLPVLERLISHGAAFASWLSQHPAGGAAALITAAIVKDIGSSMISTAVASALSKVILGAAGGNAAGGVANAAGGAAAAAGGVLPKAGKALAGAAPALALGGLALGSAFAIGDAKKGGLYAGEDATQQAFIQLRRAREMVRDGRMTAEQGDAQLRATTAWLSKAKDDAGAGNAVLAAASAPLAVISGDARQSIASYHANKQIADNSDEIGKALARLAEEIKRKTGEISHSGPPKTDPSNPERHLPIGVRK